MPELDFKNTDHLLSWEVKFHDTRSTDSITWGRFTWKNMHKFQTPVYHF